MNRGSFVRWNPQKFQVLFISFHLIYIYWLYFEDVRKTRFIRSNCQFERCLDLRVDLTRAQNWKLRPPFNSFRRQEPSGSLIILKRASVRKCIFRPGQGHGKSKRKTTGQAYAIHADCDTPSGTIVNNMVLVSNSWAYTLFDTGAFHLFISILFASTLGLEPELLDSTLSVGVPLGWDCELSYHCSLMPIKIDRRRFLVDLIVMPIEKFDVIPSSNWLCS